MEGIALSSLVRWYPLKGTYRASRVTFAIVRESYLGYLLGGSTAKEHIVKREVGGGVGEFMCRLIGIKIRTQAARYKTPPLQLYGCYKCAPTIRHDIFQSTRLKGVDAIQSAGNFVFSEVQFPSTPVSSVRSNLAREISRYFRTISTISTSRFRLILSRDSLGKNRWRESYVMHQRAGYYYCYYCQSVGDGGGIVESRSEETCVEVAQ